MKRLTKIMTAGGLAAIVAGVATGAALAGNPGSGGTPIYGCKNKTSGALRLVDANVGCGVSETRLSWNKPGMVYRGAYTSGTVYSSGNTVFYDGATWFAVKSGTGNMPYASSAYWTQVTAAGSRGVPGNQGPPGPTGNPGAAGTFTQQTGTLSGPIAIGTKLDYWRLMGTMTIHSAIPSRPYAVFVKLDAFDNSTNSDISCRVLAGGDSDSNRVSILNNSDAYDYQPMSLMVVHTFTPTDDHVYLECAANHTNANIENVTMTAIAGSSLINGGI